MNAADLSKRLADAGASGAVIAIAIEALEWFRNLPENSGKPSDYELEIARRVDRWRKTGANKKPKNINGNAEANDAASSNIVPFKRVPENSGNSANGALTYNNPENVKSIQGKEVSKDSEPRARGTRMKAGATIPEDWRQWAEREGASGIGESWVEFVDYWVGVPGQRGVKTDWFATWRNNVRRNLRMRNVQKTKHRTDNALGSAVDQAYASLTGGDGEVAGG